MNENLQPDDSQIEKRHEDAGFLQQDFPHLNDDEEDELLMLIEQLSLEAQSKELL